MGQDEDRCGVGCDREGWRDGRKENGGKNKKDKEGGGGARLGCGGKEEVSN